MSKATDAVGTVTNRSEMAAVYAQAIRDAGTFHNSEEWAALNRLIIGRWSWSGLQYIKAAAWKLLA